jgi:hypothetical protein
MGSENGHYKGLLIDWGGVLTSNLFDSFRAFCEREGIEPDEIRRRFREDPVSRELVIGLETGRLTETEFEQRRIISRRDDGRRRLARTAGRRPHRADLELVGNAPVRPRSARSVVRRDRHFRRGRDPKAGTTDLRARS